MRQKKLLLLAAGLALALAAAALAYPRLAQRYAPQSSSLLNLLGSSAPGGEGESVPLPTQPPPASQSPGPSLASEEERAPDFTVEDVQGDEVALSDFFGKPIVINLWASWCPPCLSELPAFDRAYQQYGEDFHFLMIDLTDGERETVEVARDFVEEEGYTFPVYYDVRYEAATVCGASSIPVTILIDAHGVPVAYQVGAVSEEALMNAMEELKALP